jgi:hypothetical protein
MIPYFHYVNNAAINMGILPLKMNDRNIKEVLFGEGKQQEGTGKRRG